MSIARICVLHLNQIGDLVFSLPLLKALKEHFPGARVHSVLKPHLAALLDDSPLVDAVIPRRAGLRARLELLRTIRKNHYDLLIALPRSEEALALATLSRAGLKAGFSRPFWDLALDVTARTKGHPGWVNNRSLLHKLGIPVVTDDYVGLLSCRSWTYSGDLPERFAVFAPCASGRRQTKTWGNEKFADLMFRLARDQGLLPVLVGAPADIPANQGIEELTLAKGLQRPEILNLTGKVDLKELCVVLQKARLVVGIDSGVTHLASSLDKPLVVLFGPTDPEFVGPQNRNSVIVRHAGIPCVPCYLKKCSHRMCMDAITVDEVERASRSVLHSA